MFSNSIFSLRSYLVRSDAPQDESIKKIIKGERGFFHSLRQAEKAIKSICRRYDSTSRIIPYAFLVTEVPSDELFYQIVLSERLYGPDGTLLDRTLRSEGYTDDLEKFPRAVPRFPGRLDGQVRFHVGDLVEVIHPQSRTVERMIIGRVPFSPEMVRELEEDPETAPVDIPDEYACLPLDGGKYDYFAPTRLLPLLPPLGESERETYRKYMEDAHSKRNVPRRTW